MTFWERVKKIMAHHEQERSDGLVPVTPPAGSKKKKHGRVHTQYASLALRRMLSLAGIESERQIFRDETDFGHEAEKKDPCKSLCCSTCCVLLLILITLTTSATNMIVIFTNTRYTNTNSLTLKLLHIRHVF